MEAGESRGLPTVSVIVPTRGRAEFLPRMLAPLLAEAATSELVVVVDGWDPESTAVLNDLSRSDPRVRTAVIAARGAGGLGARQAGAELARGEILLFIDDDVLAEPGLVAGHAARHAGGARRIVLGYMPVQRGPVRRRRDLASAIYDQDYELMCRSFDEEPRNILLNFWAGNFSIRRADALRIALFDPTFTPPYHADRDFGLRCRSAGLEAIFDRSLRARHHMRRSWPHFNANSRSQGLGCLLVHARHADVLGPMALSDFEPEAPRVRRMIRAARRPRLRPLVHAALSAAAAVACAARQPDRALYLARLTRLIGFQQAAIEGTRRTAVSTHPVSSDQPLTCRKTPLDRRFGGNVDARACRAERAEGVDGGIDLRGAERGRGG